ncbi:YbaK/EbsC family protein [Parendozoicomonas sp. Alg238-R29]|uniref:aminoacyl-tRNA deacylase n=1 Tax=Parendozoicomonas sp. Alg238-R29 TaxID=2993446 RepID=UPI00248E797D|nr:YbaK/EbsC family protein [Parendozoicomonas sp. Alg238-R29]
MTMSQNLSRYLTQKKASYDTIAHTRSTSAFQSAIASHIPSRTVAKAVVLKDPVDNYLMAVIPANRRLHMKVIEDIVDTPLKLAEEDELISRFRDCKTGAIPAMGEAFNMEMIWDDRFLSSSDVYLEAGDHETLVHVSGDTFRKLASNARHDQISRPERNEEIDVDAF